MTYEQMVLADTDEFGFLAPEIARALVAEHGLRWPDWLRQRPMGAVACEARPLLHWLGYR